MSDEGRASAHNIVYLRQEKHEEGPALESEAARLVSAGEGSGPLSSIVTLQNSRSSVSLHVTIRGSIDVVKITTTDF